jgi:2-methylaconitate cis-trans-isomerase PrpF
MKNYFLLLLAGSLLVLQGCTHSIHLVHLDGFGSSTPSVKQSQYVEAKTEQTVFLFFAFDTNYVEEARTKLESQCNGDLTAVSTQFSTSHGLLHWTNKILMKGVCVKA